MTKNKINKKSENSLPKIWWGIFFALYLPYKTKRYGKIETKIVICPIDCFEGDGTKYLTANKEYEVIPNTDKKNSFCIFDDLKSRLYCLYESCAHIEGLNWIIKE